MRREHDRRVRRVVRRRREDAAPDVDWSLGDPAFGVLPSNGDARRPIDELSHEELEARREYLREYVRGSFEGALSEDDFEDVVQTAWVVMLSRQGGEPVRDLRAFMGSVAWRTANGLLRRPRPTPIDPRAPEFNEREDPSELIDRVDQRARLARLGEALAQLSRPQREAYCARFVERLSHDEACKVLGIGRSAYFKRLQIAKARVEAAVGYESPEFTRRQRRLLSDYVAGIATDDERARAERLIGADPQATAMARELWRAHDEAALVLPALGLAAIESHAGDGRIAALVDRLRETVSGWFGRAHDGAELAGSAIISSGGVRGAGAAGAGLVAKAFGGLGAGNVVLGCLGGGAVATVACVAAGVIPLPGGGEQHPAKADQAVERRSVPPPRASRATPVADLVSRRPATPSPVKPPASRSEPEAQGGGEGAAQPEPVLEESAPPVQQEFTADSAGVPVGGAPPDTDDSNGASASIVREEFGP